MKLLFEIKGGITNNSNSSQENYDNEIIKQLNNDEYLKNEFEKDIREKLTSSLEKVQDIEIDIKFQKGSIIATGYLVITILGSIAGAVSFFEYAGKVIGFFINRSVDRRLTTRYPGYRSNIILLPVVQESTGSRDVASFPLLKILLYATVINIVLILGGSLFNTVQISSVQDKYREANQLISETKLNYLDRLNNLKESQSNADLEMNNIVSTLKDKVHNDSLSLQRDIDSISKGLEKLSLLLPSMEKNANELYNRVENMHSNVKKLEEKKIKWGIKDIWKFMRLNLKVIFIGLLLLLASSMFLLTRKIYLNLRD